MSEQGRHRLVFGILVIIVAVDAGRQGAVAEDVPPLGPLPSLAQRHQPHQVELGKLLFFDQRLGGDATIGCVSCHIPDQGWADGLPLSKGYPGSLYFRNTPTVLNAVHGEYLYWDGRLPASDLPTVVRDHISEAHFLQADGRLLIERLRHIPGYVERFERAFGGEPSYGRMILNAVSAFLSTLRSRDVPFDRFLRGETDALSSAARGGMTLFQGKAGCTQCHNGPMLSDGSFHGIGVDDNDEIFLTPERHITFRRFFKTLGVSEYAQLRTDPGRYAISKRDEDRGKFRTPTLRELTRTAPYMHNGSLASLEEVVEFYNAGGGPAVGKDPALQPLGLTDADKQQLVAFLQSLSGAAVSVEPPDLPRYELRPLRQEDR